jgi:TRAP transporter 4TM/12TM fusion protein
MSGAEDAPIGTGPLAILLKLAFAAFALFHIETAFLGSYDPLVQRGIFIGCGVGFVFLNQLKIPLRDWSWSAAVNVTSGIIGLYAGFYVAINADRLMDIMSDLTVLDSTLAVLMILLVLEAARRTIGLSLPIMAVLALVFYIFGNKLISGPWQPPNTSFLTVLTTMYGSTNGMFGFMADIGTRVIAIFVIFGSLLIALGAGDVFMHVAALIAGRTYGGPAKVAVVTSALFGTVSGSAVANVMSVGSITIPMMVRAGYRKDFAAGVEASASAGGQIMPPVMGAGAFIMAELLNIPYASIAAAAAIPAILYFTAIYFSVDSFARKTSLQPIARDSLPKWRDVILDRNTFVAFGPILTMAWLLFDNYTPTLAGAIATFVLIGLASATRVFHCLRENRVRDLYQELKIFGHQIWEGLVNGGSGLMVIAVLLGCASILVTMLNATGTGVKFSQFLLGLTGEHLLVILIVSAILCTLLGMDVPTTASYILTASVAAPLLTKLGLAPLSAHLFIFYFAILSALTPPVCASVYAAATLAKENFWKVAGQALRIAGGVYVVPFLFIYRPELLLYGSVPAIVYNVGISLLSVAAISWASIGYFAGRLNWLMRLYLYAASLILFYPSWQSDVVGVILVAALIFWRIVLPRARRISLEVKRS